MIAVIQRVRQASVAVENQVIAHINRGLVILLGVAQGDTGQDVSFMVEKIPRLRIFPDTQGKMTDARQDINGDLLLISQFTLLANTQKDDAQALNWQHLRKKHACDIRKHSNNSEPLAYPYKQEYLARRWSWHWTMMVQ